MICWFLKITRLLSTPFFISSFFDQILTLCRNSAVKESTGFSHVVNRYNFLIYNNLRCLFFVTNILGRKNITIIYF